MKTLLFRLRLCWICLRANRLVVFAPHYPVVGMLNIKRLDPDRISPAAWAQLCEYAYRQLDQATHAAEARLMADLVAAEDEAQQQALVEQARRLAHGLPGC